MGEALPHRVPRGTWSVRGRGERWTASGVPFLSLDLGLMGRTAETLVWVRVGRGEEILSLNVSRSDTKVVLVLSVGLCSRAPRGFSDLFGTERVDCLPPCLKTPRGGIGCRFLLLLNC